MQSRTHLNKPTKNRTRNLRCDRLHLPLTSFSRCLNRFRCGQSGNVFFVLFGAVILLGGVGSVLTSIISGPATGVGQITRRTMSEADLAGAAKILASTARATVGDCDEDDKIEPLPWRAAAGAPAPAGGGLIPSGTPAPATDKWNRAIGYCAWDHGSATVADDVAGCGGSGALRKTGGDTITEYVIALVSVGADGISQTTCRDFVDANADGEADQPLVEKVAGSDDIVLAYTYGEAFAAGEGGGTSGIGPQPDEACTPEAVGLLRDEMGNVEVCTTEGWEEIGASLAGSGNFTPLTGAQLNSGHTSNQISFSGYHGTRTATVDGGALIEVNGVTIGPTAQIKAGDQIALIADAAGVPETVRTFTLSVGAIKREWKITTRDKYPAVLTLTPSTAAGMNISSPNSNPTYGSAVVFTLQNTGEADTGILQAATLSNTTNFQFYVGGGHLGDNCNGRTLAAGQTCQIAVRPMASNDGSYLATLSVADDSSPTPLSDDADLSGTASGWTCSLDGQTVTHGNAYTFFNTAMHVNCSTVSQSRTCSFGSLSGSSTYSRANCTNTDTTPNAFSFTDVTGAALNTQITSNSVTINGINTATPVSVSGDGSPQIRIAGGSWVTSGTIADGQSLQVRLTTANANNTVRSATVNIGGVIDNWGVTTVAAANCTLGGQTVNHGSSHTFYVHTAQGGSGGQCATKRVKTCNNGVLSPPNHPAPQPQYIYASCTWLPRTWSVVQSTCSGVRPPTCASAYATDHTVPCSTVGQRCSMDGFTCNGNPGWHVMECRQW